MSIWVQPEVREALSLGPIDFEKNNRLQTLNQDVLDILESFDVPVELSEAELKTKESIKNKVERKGEVPIADLYALKIVVGDGFVERAIDALHQVYPTPKIFPWNLPSVRSGRDEFSSPQYDATHMNIVFDDDRLAEIKLFTPEQYEVEKRTREEYEERRMQA